MCLIFFEPRPSSAGELGACKAKSGNWDNAYKDPEGSAAQSSAANSAWRLVCHPTDSAEPRGDAFARPVGLHLVMATSCHDYETCVAARASDAASAPPINSELTNPVSSYLKSVASLSQFARGARSTAPLLVPIVASSKRQFASISSA